MSKVFDNGTMRDATTQEQQEINMNLGGGTGRFELVATEEISSATTRKAINLEGYDEVYISVEELQGDGNFIIQLALATTTTTTRLNDFLTSSDKVVKTLIQRCSETDFLSITNATGINTSLTLQRVSNPTGITYDDKIRKITFVTGDNTKSITKAKIKIYGRNIKE